MDWKEIIGLVASGIVVISMAFKTTTYKGTLFMRILNIIGAVGFLVYGALITSISIIVMNSFCFLFDIYYLIRETIDYKKGLKQND